MSLYEGSVKKPIMTSLCFVAVAIMGLFSLTKLPIDLFRISKPIRLWS